MEVVFLPDFLISLKQMIPVEQSEGEVKNCIQTRLQQVRLIRCNLILDG
jgi:hypothetical protein